MINIHQKEVGREASFYFQLIENMVLSIFSHLLFIHSPWKWMDCYTPCLLSCWKCLPVLPSSPRSSHLALKHYLFQPCRSVFCDKVQLWAALLTLLCCRKNSLATLFHLRTLLLYYSIRKLSSDAWISSETVLAIVMVLSLIF